jgi:hypothetical protein
VKVLAVVFTAFFVASCSQASDKESEVKAEVKVAVKSPVLLDVYKSPSCGCCKKWIAHLEESGFQSKAHNRNDVSSIKQEKGIAPRYRSCHTAISKEGYAFEGHVPAKFIEQFLSENHQNVIGLSVPAMPVGTPGMEMGDKFMPYHVLLLKKDGSSEVYAKINSYKEQF